MRGRIYYGIPLGRAEKFEWWRGNVVGPSGTHLFWRDAQQAGEQGPPVVMQSIDEEWIDG